MQLFPHSLSLSPSTLDVNFLCCSPTFSGTKTVARRRCSGCKSLDFVLPNTSPQPHAHKFQRLSHPLTNKEKKFPIDFIQKGNFYFLTLSIDCPLQYCDFKSVLMSPLEWDDVETKRTDALSWTPLIIWSGAGWWMDGRRKQKPLSDQIKSHYQAEHGVCVCFFVFFWVHGYSRAKPWPPELTVSYPPHLLYSF